MIVPPTGRSPIIAIESVMGAPSSRKKRSGAALWGPKSTFGPSSRTAASPPRPAISSTSASAIASSASSQEMRRQRPEPRGPARCSGCSRREGPSSRSLAQAPLLQPRGLKSGTEAFEAA